MYMATRFTWDVNKNQANRRKHGISFETATKVFADAATRTSMASNAGIDGEPVRIISARKVTPRERRLYEEGDY